jgi:single-strand DNA-binding protein
MYLNKAIVIGNLTRDPEIKALPGGSKVCTFSVATNRVWKDKNGAKQESVDYHNVVVFGRQAETAGQYLRKGSSALVEGRMQTRSWDGTDGQKKYRTELVADRVQFGNRPTTGGPSTGSAPSSAKGISEDPTQKDAPPVDTIDYPEEEINPDDIPF